MQTRMKWMLVLGVAVMTAACGDSKSSLLPTAPSALSSDTASASTADGHYETTANGPKPGNGNGNGNGNGGNNGNGNGNQPAPGKTVVQFEGLIEALDGRGSIKVNGQWIGTNADTVIRHGNRQVPLADLKPTDRVHVRANRVEGQALLEALEINLQSPGAGDGVTTVPAPLPPPPPPPDPDQVVTVTAVDSSASENGSNPGLFRLTRSATDSQQANSLTVQVALSGNATAGSDYAAFGPTVMFLAGSLTVDVPVTPVADSTAESTETLVLEVVAGAGYQAGLPSSASVELTDNPPPAVWTDVDIANPSEAGSIGRFTVWRTGGNLSQPLTVSFTLTGAAEHGVDYWPTQTTVTFPAGMVWYSVTIIPKSDSEVDPLEDIILTVVGGAGYVVGNPSVATMMLSGQ